MALPQNTIPLALSPSRSPSPGTAIFRSQAVAAEGQAPSSTRGVTKHGCGRKQRERESGEARRRRKKRGQRRGAKGAAGMFATAYWVEYSFWSEVGWSVCSINGTHGQRANERTRLVTRALG